MPRAFAVSDMLKSAWFNALFIAFFSASSLICFKFKGAESVFGDASSKSSVVMNELSAIITARLIRLSISRTLPGHS